MDGVRLLLSLLSLLSLPVVVSTECQTSLFSNSSGFISSPGFNTSQSYDDNLTCTYRIMVPVNRRVILEFKKLSILGTMPNCEEDSLEILVGCSNASIGKFCSCSDLAMPKIYSLDNCITLIFKSDGSKKAEGFEATYTSIDNSTKLDRNSDCSSTELLEPSKGTFYTPNWPLTYPPNATCLWTFSPPEEKIVRLFFMSFEMEEKYECAADSNPITADEIRINGTNSTGGKVDIVPRICAKPDKLYYTIKQMQAVTVKFASNFEDEFSGAIAGYASYKEGTGALESNSVGCQAIQVPESTTSTTRNPIVPNKASGKQTLVKALGVVGAAVLAVVVFL